MWIVRDPSHCIATELASPYQDLRLEPLIPDVLRLPFVGHGL